MNKTLSMLFIAIIVSACASASPPSELVDEQTMPSATSVSPTETPIPATPDLTAGWTEYVNDEVGYSFLYPSTCSLGPLADSCKQDPPEARAPGCLCFVDGEDPASVTVQSFVENADDGLTMVTLNVAQRDTPAFAPPVGEDWVQWLQGQWPLVDDMPDEANSEIDGVPAVRVYVPGSPQAFSSEHVFVVKNGKLIYISLVDVDPETHRQFYDALLGSFRLRLGNEAAIRPTTIRTPDCPP